MWCSFFWGQNDPENFFEVSEKRRKNRKKCVFLEKKLMVSGPFLQKVALPFNIRILTFYPWKKMSKKGISFFETFFLKWKLDIYFCPFLKLKKKFWKLKNFPFSPSRWIYSVKWRVEWVCGGIFIDKNPTTYQKILRNREFHIFLQESRFWGIFW